MGSTQSYSVPRQTRAGQQTPHLELCLECDRIGAGAARFSLLDIDAVTIGRGARRAHETSVENGQALITVSVPDRWMSEVHGRLTREGQAWRLEDAGSKNGTFVNGEKVERAVLEPGDLIVLGHTLWRFVQAAAPLDSQCRVTELTAPLTAFSTLNPELERRFQEARLIARAPISVLLEGQTGTGKEVVARALHDNSERTGAFIAVNCGAIPSTLMESELFGYTKGAFSGAVDDRPGLIRAANGGTLFLDEVAELPWSMQVALLRVLQEKEVLPVGQTRPVPVDVRVIAATHQSIDELVEKGTFRADLKARLCGFRLSLPPLSKRSEDLGPLIGTLLQRLDSNAAARVSLTPAAACALFSYPWPANVRELEQAIRAALALAPDGAIDLVHLPPQVRTTPIGPPREVAQQRRANNTVEQQLDAVLRKHNGNIAAVARELYTSRAQIHRLCKRYGLDVTSYR